LIDSLNRNKPINAYYDKVPYLMKLMIRQRKPSLAVQKAVAVGHQCRAIMESSLFGKEKNKGSLFQNYL
jgi:hypothetical protein